MPIVLDQSAPEPPLPTEIVSVDGRLSATVDPGHAGVLLYYNGTELDPPPVHVRFSRAGGDPVRSGDVAYAPGGSAVAYDGEVGLGAAAAYEAIPIGPDGTEGEPSALALLSANPYGRGLEPGVWLKATDGQVAQVTVSESSEVDYSGQADSATVLGSSHPVVVSGPHTAPTFTLTILSFGTGEHAALSRLLALPGYTPDGQTPATLLVQYARQYQRRDRYCAISSVKESPDRLPVLATRQFAVELISTARPDPSGAPLRIPGRSYAEVDAQYRTYADMPPGKTYLSLTLGEV